MGYSSGRAAGFGGTGTKTLVTNLTGAPTWCRVTVGGKAAGGDTQGHFSVGTCDGTRQNTQSTYSDTTGSASFSSNAKLVSHYERVAGTITEVINAAFSSFGTSGGSGTVVFTVTTDSANYDFTLEVGN